MSFFKTLFFGKEKSWAPSDDRWYSLSLPSSTRSGTEVNEFTSLNYSSVFCAINLIAGTCGTLPLFLYKKTKDGKEKAVNHPLYHVLHTKPNQYMTAVGAREAMTGHLVSWGNCFAEKVMDQSGRIHELFPIPPNRVKIEIDKGVPTYLVTVDSEQIPMSRDNMLHIPGLGWDGFMGYSVLTNARESIGLGLGTEEFGARFFGSGTHPSSIFKHPGKLSEPAHDRLKDSLTTAYSGLGNSHKAIILEEGMDLAKIGVAPNDAQFLETRRFQVEEIARWFNLPVHKLKEMTKSSFSNIESEQISFVMDSIRPWLVRIEQNYNCQLLTEAELRAGYFFEHEVSGLMRGDAEARSNFYSAMFMIGVMSINEIRAKENMNDVDGGDARFVPLNMVPLGMAEEAAKQNVSDKTLGDPTQVGGSIKKEDLFPLFTASVTQIVNREGLVVKRVADKEKLTEFYSDFSDYIVSMLNPVYAAAGVPYGLKVHADKYVADSYKLFSGLLDSTDEEIDTFVKQRIAIVTEEFYQLTENCHEG